METAPNYTVLLDSDDKPVILKVDDVYRFQFRGYRGETDEFAGAFRKVYKKDISEYYIVIDISKPFKQSTAERNLNYLDKVIPIAEWEAQQAENERIEKELGTSLEGI